MLPGADDRSLRQYLIQGLQCLSRKGSFRVNLIGSCNHEISDPVPRQRNPSFNDLLQLLPVLGRQLGGIFQRGNTLEYIGHHFFYGLVRVEVRIGVTDCLNPISVGKTHSQVVTLLRPFLKIPRPFKTFQFWKR